jgi:hypothetical protein
VLFPFDVDVIDERRYFRTANGNTCIISVAVEIVGEEDVDLVDEKDAMKLFRNRSSRRSRGPP